MHFAFEQCELRGLNQKIYNLTVRRKDYREQVELTELRWSEVTISHCTEMHYQKLRAFGLFQLLTILVQQLRGRVKIVLSVQCFSPVHYTCTQVAHVNFCVGPTRP